jgi:hypothetical protein
MKRFSAPPLYVAFESRPVEITPRHRRFSWTIDGVSAGTAHGAGWRDGQACSMCSALIHRQCSGFVCHVLERIEKELKVLGALGERVGAPVVARTRVACVRIGRDARGKQ